MRISNKLIKITLKMLKKRKKKLSLRFPLILDCKKVQEVNLLMKISTRKIETVLLSLRNKGLIFKIKGGGHLR
jgi:hypothetical protein